MASAKLRAALTTFWTPLARVLMKIGVKPDAVTVTGTLVTSAAALYFLPTGRLFWGGILIGVFALFDSLDGVLARLSDGSSTWGAFLDSTLDRISDGAVFVGVALFFVLRPEGPFHTWGASAAIACLLFGSVVPYARAKAESLGCTASVGIFERWVRLVGALVPMGLTAIPGTSVALPMIVAVICLTILAVGSTFTVIQRMASVHQQLHAREADRG